MLRYKVGVQEVRFYTCFDESTNARTEPVLFQLVFLGHWCSILFTTSAGAVTSCQYNAKNATAVDVSVYAVLSVKWIEASFESLA